MRITNLSVAVVFSFLLVLTVSADEPGEPLSPDDAAYPATKIPGVSAELARRLPQVPEHNYGGWRNYENRNRPDSVKRKYFEFDPRRTPIPENPALKTSVEIEPLMRRIQHDPEVGSVAPDFEAPLLRTDENGKPIPEISDRTFRLSDYRGKKPVVMLMYNGTCSGPTDAAHGIDQMYSKYKDQVEFRFVSVIDHGYWHQLKSFYSENSSDPRYWHIPRDMNERIKQVFSCRRDMAKEEFRGGKGGASVTYPIALDKMNNPIARLYRTAPPKMVAVDIDGRIAARGWTSTGKTRKIIRQLADGGRMKKSHHNPVPEGDYPAGWHTDYGDTNKPAFVAYLYFLHAEKRWADAVSLMAMMRKHFDEPAMIEYGTILLKQASRAMSEPQEPDQTVPVSHIRLLRDYLIEQAQGLEEFSARKAVLGQLNKL